jgi:hypothetical protein
LLVQAAVDKSWLAFQHVAPELQADRLFIARAVAIHGTGLLRYASAQLLSDRQCVSNALLLRLRMRLKSIVKLAKTSFRFFCFKFCGS